MMIFSTATGWSIRWLAVLALAISAGCAPAKQKPLTSIPPLADEPEQAAAAPAIPTPLKAESVAPMGGHDPSKKSPLIDIMAEENARWMETIRKNPKGPAFYLAYYIYDQRTVVIEAEGGALTIDSDERDRFLDVEVRTGTPELDNLHPLSKDPVGLNAPLTRRGRVPMGTDKLAIQSHLWLETDRRYREASLQLQWVRTDTSMTAESRADPDFVHEKPEYFIEPEATLSYDKKYWAARIRDCSRRALKGVATVGSCRVVFGRNTVYFVNSEGTRIQKSWPTAQLMVNVSVKADDGMPLNRLEQRFARTPKGLPGKAAVDKIINLVNRDLDALHRAPVVDPFVGPAILEGRAAAVFFHEVFGHRIEGHRQKGTVSGRTFSSKIGEQIMPEWINVYDDPTLDSINGVSLNGFYRFDDEGVRAQRASLVKDGVLVGFVMGRNPIEGFPNSNGHGRKQPGLTSVSRQGNLVVEAARTVEDKDLRAELIAEIKRQDKPFGMIFTDISGGFTNTTSFAPQAFKVNPVMAYRLYPDGRRQLVRGVDIVGTPLTALGSILAAGRTLETFNGTCGAESGWVPVSATAPSLLVKSLEVERRFSPTDRSPVLPQPSLAQGNE